MKKQMRKSNKKISPIVKILKYLSLIILLVVVSTGIYLLNYYNLIPKRSYRAKDFGIETLRSDFDQDNDEIDDYTDIMLGAREYVKTKPEYDGSYHKGGYPPEGIGVCTDVIWKGFEAAGYSLKNLVDQDIAKYVSDYPRVNGKPDPNIDFRRVQNLHVFLEKHATSLTKEVFDPSAWQPGDIVVYDEHIAIVSDKRNKHGLPYIIHHGGQPMYEEDALTRSEILGHYRWK